MQALFRTLTF